MYNRGTVFTAQLRSMALSQTSEPPAVPPPPLLLTKQPPPSRSFTIFERQNFMEGHHFNLRTSKYSPYLKQLHAAHTNEQDMSPFTWAQLEREELHTTEAATDKSS